MNLDNINLDNINLQNIPDLQDVDKTGKAASFLQGKFNFNLPNGFVFQPSYIQAALIVFLIFLLVLTLGSLRHRMNHWQMRGAIPGIMFGFTLALLIEGILLVTGGTIITKTLGWKNAPKPISVALDQGKAKLTDVLGTSSEIERHTENMSPEEVLQGISQLSPSEFDSIVKLVCEQ